MMHPSLKEGEGASLYPGLLSFIDDMLCMSFFFGPSDMIFLQTPYGKVA